MRVHAELHPRVVSYLRRLPESDGRDFLAQLELVGGDPIGRSEFFFDQNVGRHAMRRFEFGLLFAHLAVFHYDGNRLRVIECRLAKPKRRRNPRNGGRAADRKSRPD